MKFNPEAVLARREHVKRSEQRVEARRELSGNASLAGRELDTADVLASKAYIDAVAVKLRNSGLVDGTLARLRALAMVDLTQGRNPLDRINPSRASSHGQGGSPASPGSPGNPGSDDKPASPASADSPGSPASPASARWPGWDPDQADPGLQDLQDRLADERDCRPGGPVRPGASAPLPALVNLLVPVGTLLGWSAAPAQAGPWGLLDAEETRAVAGAAAAHPRTRWCLTVTAPDGTALAHGCARGQHPRLLDGIEPQPPPRQLAELLRRLAVDFTPIARGSCDHAQAEAHYTPSRMLKHLVRARAATCDAPGCQAQASTADLDHTVPWPDGPTEQCNLAPRCRTHHRAKQARDWSVEQAAPGVTRWRLPSGRVHVTTPTTYDL